MQTTSPAFKTNARTALADAGLQRSLARSKTSFQAKRSAAIAALPEFERLREIGRDIKDHALANLDFYLETYAENVERAGGTVHWCPTADDARDAVLRICQAAGARTVTKGKSMISEELEVNGHLERHGLGRARRGRRAGGSAAGGTGVVHEGHCTAFRSTPTVRGEGAVRMREQGWSARRLGGAIVLT